MPANTSPIFTLAPRTAFINTVITANTTKDLTSGTIYLIMTAGANGSYVEKIIVQPLGTNIATVLRFWINNGSTTGTASNNTYIKDVTMPATTNSETAAIGNAEVPLNIAIPAGYTLYVTTGTTVAAGFDVCAVGGDY
jgi:hypothetical protein